MNKLTPRERQVLRVMAKADDTSDKGLASLLNISRKTVDTHLKHIREKLGVKTRTAAIIKWLQSVSVLCFLGGLLCHPALAEDARLNIVVRTNDVILYVSGGTNTVQYMIYTSPDNTVTSTNWYYWNRAYPLKEFVVYNHLASTNQAAGKPQRFFQIRGILPD